MILISEKNKYPEQGYIAEIPNGESGSYVLSHKNSVISKNNPIVVKLQLEGDETIHELSYTCGVTDGSNITSYGVSYTGTLFALITTGVNKSIKLIDILYYVTSDSVDKVLSHLADINWPYPTGTVHYFDKSYVPTEANAIDFVGETRYSGELTQPNSNTVCTYNWPAHKTRDISNSVVWNTTYVDTSKSNTCTIDMNNTYIDIRGYFYLKTAITTGSSWTFAYLPSSVITYNQAIGGADGMVWISNGIWQDESGSYSGTYIERQTGENSLQLRGCGYVRKDKATTGIAAGYATYFHFRLIPKYSASADNFTLISYTVDKNNN